MVFTTYFRVITALTLLAGCQEDVRRMCTCEKSNTLTLPGGFCWKLFTDPT